MNELTREAVDYVLAKRTSMFRDMAKAALICEMRLSGMTYKDIGEEVGLSPSRVGEYVHRICWAYTYYRRRLERQRAKRITLFDQIKGMSVTELAEFLDSEVSIIRQAEKYSCNKCKKAHNGICPANDDICVIGKWTDAELIREWLMQEVKV